MSQPGNLDERYTVLVVDDTPDNLVLMSGLLKDLYKVKQLQGGKWQVVWPKEYAAPGAQLIGP